jgi:hypothetical protein
MHAFVAAFTGFLLAVLWFDLMFDVQVRKHAGTPLPEEVLGSISAYYRRVTTEAYPMNRLVGAVIVLNLVAIVAEIVAAASPWWVGWGSLALVGVGSPRTFRRTLPNAQQLGRGADSAEVRSGLARAIYRDHVFAFARMSVVLGLQLFPW